MNDSRMIDSRVDVIRAWKDPSYRAGLSEDERAALPEHPSGLTELSDAELGDVEGGEFSLHILWTGLCVDYK